MKNITQTIVFLTLVLTAGIIHAAPLQISITIPAEALVTSDLDARDALNRPLRHTAQVRLVELFSKSLNRMLLNSLTPIKMQMLALLNSNWDGFAGVLKTARRVLLEPVISWIIAKKAQIKISSSSSVVAPLVASPQRAARDTGDAFSFLIHLVISSTRLLR